MSRSEQRRAVEAIAFRLDPEVARQVAAKAARHGLSPGQFARALVLADAGKTLPVLRRGPPPDAAALRSLIGQIGKIGSNLNQIARLANSPNGGLEREALERALQDLASMRSAVLDVLGVRDP